MKKEINVDNEIKRNLTILEIGRTMKEVNIKFDYMLRNKELLQKYWMPYKTIEELRKIKGYFEKDFKTFIDSERERELILNEVGKHYPDLVKVIRKMLEQLDPRELDYLLRFIKIFNEIPEENLGDIRKEINALYPNFRDNLLYYKDKKTADKTHKSVLKIINGELDLLNWCVDDVGRWGDYYAKMDKKYVMREFAKIIRNYFYGKEGLLSKYKDKELKALLGKKDYSHILELWRYGKQIKFVDDLKEMVIKGKEEGKWEHFTEFWKGIDKDIKTFRKYYKNKEFAELLAKYKEEVQQYPDAWKIDLKKMEDTLLSPKYELSVLEKAQKDLAHVFNLRKISLESEIREGVKEFKALISHRITQIDNGLKKMPGIIDKKIDKQIGRLERELDVLIDAVFEQNLRLLKDSNNVENLYKRFLAHLHNHIGMGVEHIKPYWDSGFKSFSKWMDFSLPYSNAIPNYVDNKKNITWLNSTLAFAASKSVSILDRLGNLIEKTEKLDRHSIMELNKVSSLSNKFYALCYKSGLYIQNILEKQFGLTLPRFLELPEIKKYKIEEESINQGDINA